VRARVCCTRLHCRPTLRSLPAVRTDSTIKHAPGHRLTHPPRLEMARLETRQVLPPRPPLEVVTMEVVLAVSRDTIRADHKHSIQQQRRVVAPLLAVKLCARRRGIASASLLPVDSGNASSTRPPLGGILTQTMTALMHSTMPHVQ